MVKRVDYFICDITKDLVEKYSIEEVADKLNVTVNTVYRWLRGRSKPQPKQEALLRKTYYDYRVQSNEFTMLIDTCLNELREIFHKTSRFSSRNEALEEISKLFFSHIISVMNDEEGISNKLCMQKGKSAKLLKEFVDSKLKGVVRKKQEYVFSLNLKENENQFAEEIIHIFDKNLCKKVRFDCISGTDILNDIFGKFLTDSFVDKKQLGQYLTPQEIVSFAINLYFSDIDVSEVVKEDSGFVLDPSCGVGSFLTAYVDKVYKEMEGDKERKNILRDIVENRIIGIDKSERMIKLAMINLAMFGYSNTELFLHNALDFSGIDLENKVSLIMTNPPFGAEFSAKEVEHFRIVSKWPDKKPLKVNSKVLFIEQYINWLKPDGALICIVPDSILNNKGIYEVLRNGISKEISIQAVISLPSNTFATTGTETKTSLLYIKKKLYDKNHKTYLAICENNGYDVVSAGAHKTKKYNGCSDLKEILNDYINKTEEKGQWVAGLNDFDRWDAAYHATITKKMMENIKQNGLVQVKDVANLSVERFNPKRLSEGEYFDYIEISDVDSNQLRAYGKKVLGSEAPSRARKIVHKDDIIISTVRPERGIVAVVDENQEGSVCTTGFAVIHPKEMDSMVLALILQSEFVLKQIKKYAMGISYPVIDEKNFMEIYLPLKKTDYTKYNGVTDRIKQLENELCFLRAEFKKSISLELLDI